MPFLEPMWSSLEWISQDHAMHQHTAIDTDRHCTVYDWDAWQINVDMLQGIHRYYLTSRIRVASPDSHALA